MTVLASFVLMTFPIAMAFAAANDLFTMKIPNRISIALIGSFLAVALLTQMPLETFTTHVAFALCVLATTYILFALNMLGGGDAKLMAAGALWMDGEHLIEFLAYVTIFGGILSVLILGYRNFIPANSYELPGWARRLHATGGPIPYGIAIAAAALVLFPTTALFRALMA